MRVIAEIGINHNGDLDVCKDLITVANNAGCDAVKFQKREIPLVYTEADLAKERKSPWGSTQRAQKLGLEFGVDEYREIDSFCKSLGIDWFASAWDPVSQNFLRQFNCKFNKIASAMIVCRPFLEMVAAESKHTFVSTGMATMDQIADAVKIFRDAKCSFELMHTVSTYPMKEQDANLRMINTLKSEFECDVGYSGHETGIAISCAAAAFDISSLERHITLDRSMYGSDQAASLEPAGLNQLVGAIRKIEISLGDGVKKIIEAELPVAEKLRAHLDDLVFPQ